MHKIISFFLKKLDDVGRFLNLVCAFLIFSLTLYWIETAINADWKWLNFIKPVLNNIIYLSKEILPLKLHELVERFNSGFIVAIALIIVLMVLIKYIFEKADLLQIHYEKMHISHKLYSEKAFNKKLEKNLDKEQDKISKYMVLVNTKIKKKYLHLEIKIDAEEQNKLMNDFIFSKTEAKYQMFNGGFLYYFDDFNQIDEILTVLFKLIKSPSTPLDFAICIQSGDDLDQIETLSNYKSFGKIIMSPDTLLRYRHKKAHKFGTTCVGVYQKEEDTIEVHEFQEIAI